MDPFQRITFGGELGQPHNRCWKPPTPALKPETLVLYRKRAEEKAVGQREGPSGALSIQPFEGSRDTYAVAYGF